MVSKARYEEMLESYDKVIGDLKKDVEYWCSKYCAEIRMSRAAEIYEAILAKQGILGESSNYTDKTFVFEGKVYKPISYTLRRDPSKCGELDVEFIEQSV